MPNTGDTTMTKPCLSTIQRYANSVGCHFRKSENDHPNEDNLLFIFCSDKEHAIISFKKYCNERGIFADEDIRYDLGWYYWYFTLEEYQKEIKQ